MKVGTKRTMDKDSEKRICQNCHNEFIIEPDDFVFYEKMKVPPPTFCPECRQSRRYAWRNERVLYRRNCDLCGKSTVTIYSPNKPYKVYCTYHTGKCPNEFETTYRPNRPEIVYCEECYRQEVV